MVPNRYKIGSRRAVFCHAPCTAWTASIAAPGAKRKMSEQDDVLAGGGELGARIREIDWSKTALGPVTTWSQSLRSALSICLGSRFPIAIYWGPELVLLYNDAWSPILGEKHPSSLGRPGREVWPEIWDTIGPMFEQVMTTAEPMSVMTPPSSRTCRRTWR